MTEKTIYFDMDGTLADFYGVENWLNYLNKEQTKPYREAKAMLDLRTLNKVLNTLQKEGYKIGIVSWLSKTGSDDFQEKIEKTKRNWLKKHMGTVVWDEIQIVSYGVPKATVVSQPNSILFDDELRNREQWLGQAYSEKEIMEVLQQLI